jgi:hypothetical protein
MLLGERNIREQCKTSEKVSLFEIYIVLAWELAILVVDNRVSAKYRKRFNFVLKNLYIEYSSNSISERLVYQLDNRKVMTGEYFW